MHFAVLDFFSGIHPFWPIRLTNRVQWCDPFVFSMVLAWASCWTNSWIAVYWRHHMTSLKNSGDCLTLHMRWQQVYYKVRVTHIWVGKLGQHCFKYWLVACSAPNHYLNQCWVITNWTFWEQTFYQESLENVIYKMVVILFCLKVVNNTCIAIHNMTVNKDYRKTSNISRTLVGNKIVDNSDVVGASPVGAAPTTSSFST